MYYIILKLNFFSFSYVNKEQYYIKEWFLIHYII